MFEDCNQSKKSIAKKLDVDINTVRHVLKTYEETGDVVPKHKGGRKRKISNADAKQMVKKAKSGKFASDLADDYARTRHRIVSNRTVQRTLKRRGLKYKKVRELDQLNPTQIAKRLAYAEEKLDYNWRYVLFTDEKTFPLGVAILTYGRTLNIL